jgi:hypothetical protein
MIQDNQQVTINVVAHHLCISNGFAHGIIQDWLQFHKVVKDGVQNNSQKRASASTWQSAKTYWTAIVKKLMFFEMHSYWGWDVDPPLSSRKRMPEYGMETSNMQVEKKSKLNH